MAKPLALTSGEPAGIGPDIAIAAWLRRNELALPPFYLLGDRTCFAERAKILGLKVELADTTPGGCGHSFCRAHCRWWRPASRQPRSRASRTPTSASAALASIRQAVDHVRAGRASAVVTNPIAKSVLYRAGFRHPGHTEFLAELAADGGAAPQPVMMLWSPALAVVPVTIHLSLRDALAQLSTDLIVDDRPHRGGRPEGPLWPRQPAPRRHQASIRMPAKTARSACEDIEVVAPAVDILRRDGIEVRGPLPADTMFHEAARKTYDCAICMYHDQALIPIKTIAFEDARQRHAGIAVHPHLAGSRHRLRHRRHRPRQPVEPRRGAAARRAHGGGHQPE